VEEAVEAPTPAEAAALLLETEEGGADTPVEDEVVRD